MNDQLKQRLVGAIVLVSLAVIFIPMILPGGGMGDSLNIRKVPPEPDYRFTPPKSAPKAPPMSAAVIVPMGDAKLSSGTSVKKASSKKTSDSKTISKNSIVTTSDKKLKTKPAQVTAWIVQVGSFTSAPNAKALQDKLRKMGYASFVEAVKSKSGMNYRVRVGPELKRTTAEKLQKQLAEKAKLKGMVQSYP
ncbi:MAG: SPOR domain-containing protein [Proteobacteria bacterium]|nr:SPOR domain-containing protein [Pseudomonadota bacterium]